MDWDQLKKLKCPKCGGILREKRLFVCSCGFIISKGKLYDIIGKKPKSLGQQANDLLKKPKKFRIYKNF
jgi:hypothetical protein